MGKKGSLKDRLQNDRSRHLKDLLKNDKPGIRCPEDNARIPPNTIQKGDVVYFVENNLVYNGKISGPFHEDEIEEKREEHYQIQSNLREEDKLPFILYKLEMIDEERKK